MSNLFLGSSVPLRLVLICIALLEVSRSAVRIGRCHCREAPGLDGFAGGIAGISGVGQNNATRLPVSSSGGRRWLRGELDKGADAERLILPLTTAFCLAGRCKYARDMAGHHHFHHL